ncbi:hypothetical protein ACFFQW_19590 [Umezawaea endophytica]|uniref:Uncharacterized protein n=1 Tax=Umezawaea endophytica TaxID=1654476 RepID=A0A9X3AGG5_9PSEU|nr:hypothetical protein [Umezawaea endophytica]MCS7479611.1 hypothetical protein [Umezawaea endophytica]
MNTPANIDDLTHRTAQALVQAMHTDQWHHAREWLTGFLTTNSTDPTPVLAEAEHSRALLTQADHDDLATLHKAATKALAIRLRQASTNHPTAGEEFRDYLAEHTEPTPPTNPHVVQNAYATTKGQIFQTTGHQHITLNPKREHR